MPDLGIEEFYESDFSDNEDNHSKLLNSVLQLDSTQRVKPAQKKEVASEVSEYNLNQGLLSNKNLVRVKELAEALGKKSEHGIITKKIEKVIKNLKTLPKPLEKPIEERLKRSMGFENVKKQLGRWDAIVSRNALKDCVSFPLNINIKIQESSEFLSQFKTKTPLEEEISKTLKQETQEEKEIEDNEFPLTLQEMMERRKQLAQIRAKLSYRQSKAQRQSKIKSKKYHRLLKHEKLRQQIKEFELLQKTDPEAALKKLSELDKTRAQERASLRHRNTGQWAKNLSVRARYDVETRKVLADQLKMSRELTQKISRLDSSDDEDDDVAQPENVFSIQTTNGITSDNPWTLDVAKEVQDFVSGYKKFWTEKSKELNHNKAEEENRKSDSEKITDNIIINGENMKDVEVQEPKIKKTNKQGITAKGDLPKKKLSTKMKKTCLTVHPASGVWIVTPVENESISEKIKKQKADDMNTLFDDLNDELMRKAIERITSVEKSLEKNNSGKNQTRQKRVSDDFDLSLKHKNIVERPDVDVGLLEGGTDDDVFVKPSMNTKFGCGDDGIKAAPAIDPTNFIQIKPKRLRTHLPENTTEEGEAVDDAKTQEKIIEEAFGGDDVMAEFKEMKEEEEKSNKVEIETSLPGWGEWGGIGIVSNPRKKRRLVPTLPPRKDKIKKDVIINENENPNLKNHLVKEVPHPFKSVEAFEANIRAPVGRDWVPETAHQKLIQKQVVTKLGTIIEPMSEEEIVRLKKASKSPYQGRKKKGNKN